MALGAQTLAGLADYPPLPLRRDPAPTTRNKERGASARGHGVWRVVSLVIHAARRHAKCTGLSATVPSVVINSPATEEVSCNSTRTTLVGSMIRQPPCPRRSPDCAP